MCGVDYELTTTITDGDYVIGCIKGSAGNDNVVQAINATITSGWGQYTSITPSSGKISNPDASVVWTLTKIGDNSFSLKNGSVYYKITTGTGNGSVGTNASSQTIYYAAVGGSTNAFELSGVSTFTVSSGNQLGCNQQSGNGYRQYAQREHGTTNTGISTQVRFYKKASSSDKPNVSFNPVAGKYSTAQNVTLTSSVDGATIYYTTDGTDPTTSSSQYSSAIPVSATTTIKAFAKKDDDAGTIASATYTFPYTSIATLLPNVTTTEVTHYVKMTNWIVTGVATDGKNAYLTEGTEHGMLAYKNSIGLVEGNVLNGTIDVKAKIYSNIPEFTNLAATGVEGLTVTTGGTPTVYNKAIGELASATYDNNGIVVKLSGVTYDATEDALSDGVNSLPVTNKIYADLDLTDGQEYNITGVIGYTTASTPVLQIYPRSEDDIEAVGGPVIVKTLESIAVTGMSTTYEVGETFSFNGTCTATYSVTVDDEPQEEPEYKVVTPTSVSSPDMSTTGSKEITVTYTESEVTKTAKYTITVNPVAQYAKVTAAPEDWSGEYLLVYESSASEAYVWTGVEASNCYATATISSGKISKPSGAVSLTIASMEGGYSIKVNGGTNNGKYIYGTSGSNGVSFGNAESVNTLALSGGDVTITSNTSFMQYNSSSGQDRFRYYKSGTTTQKNVQLYKKMKPTHTMTFSTTPDGGGSVVVSAGGAEIASGDAVEEDATVTMTPSANTYYQLSSVEILDGNADEITPTVEAGVYSFTMPTSNVEAGVTFALIPVTSVTVDATLGLVTGEFQTLTATVLPATANPAVSWLSDAPGIATVDENGKVTAVSVGTAHITATSTVTPAKLGTCTVTVSAPAGHSITITQNAGGTVTANVAVGDVAKETAVTLTAAPTAGYTVSGWTIGGVAVGDLAISEDKTTCSFSMPDANVTAEASYTHEVATLKLHDANGESTFDSENTHYWKEEVTLPTSAAECSKTFVGWSENPDCATAPELGATYVIPNKGENNHIYAVYADVDYTWNEITTVPTEGTYAICAATYALKASTNSGRFENGEIEIEDGKLTSAPAESCIWELSINGSGKFLLKNGTNYAAGTTAKNKGALVTDATEAHAQWEITYETDKFVVKNVGRPDDSDTPANAYLRQNGANGWACYSSGQGNAPRFFKKTLSMATASNYSTSCDPLPTPVVQPTITTQPEGAVYTKDAPATALTIVAEAGNGGALSYQWYSNDENSTEGAEAIEGADEDEYTPSTGSITTTYYYCVVSEVGADAPTTSDIVAIVVNAAPEPTGTFELFEGALEEGDYVIVSTNALSNEVNSKRIAAEAVTISENKIVNPAASVVWHIAQSGDYWTIYNAAANKYAAGTTSKNEGALLDEVADLAKWSCESTGSSTTYDFANKGRAEGSSDTGNKWLRYNSSTGNINSRWGCYGTGTGSAVTLYKLEDASKPKTPTFSPAGGTYTEAQTVTITSATDGVTIYYTTDGTTPNTGSSVYSSPITVDEDKTLKAIAVKDEVSSSVGTATYTINLPLTTIDAIFAKATAVGSTATDVTIVFNNWVVSGVSTNGKNVYVTDGTKGFIIFDNGGEMGFAVGNVLSGTVACKVQLYNGAAELTTLSSETEGLGVATGGSVSPASVAPASLAGINTGALISLSNWKYDGTNLTDGTTEIQPYNTLYAYGEAFVENHYYNVAGIYHQYNGKKEILPRSEDDIEELAQTAPTMTWYTSSTKEVTIAANATYSVDLGDAFAPVFETNSEGEKTYTSSDPTIATIDGSTGALTLQNKVGSTIIKCAVAADATNNFAADEQAFTLNVREGAQTGNVVILAEYDGAWYAMKNTFSDTKTAYALAVAYTNGAVICDNESDIASILWKRTVDAEGKTTFQNPSNNQYLKTNGNDLKLEANETGNYQWTWNDTYYRTGAQTRTFVYRVSANNGFRSYAVSNAGSSDYSELPVIYTGDVYVKKTSGTVDVSTQTEGLSMIIYDNVTLNADAAKTLGSLIVEAGGKVSDGSVLTVKDLTINTQSGKSGQVLGTNFDVTGNLYLDVQLCSGSLDADYWYIIAVPFDVNISDGISLADGTPMTNGVDYEVWIYDTQKRAQTTNGWKRANGKMEAGKAYFIGFNPGMPNTVRLKAAPGWKDHLFGGSSLALTETAEETSAGVHDNWNGIANPKMRYVGIDKENVQMYSNETHTFSAYTGTAYDFVVGTAFFVKSTGNVTIADADGSHSQFLAPKRDAERKLGYEVRITPAEAAEFDNQIIVRASESANGEYNSNRDMLTLNEATSKSAALLWTENYGDKRLAIEEAPLVNSSASYVLGIYAPADGEYTISTPQAKEDVSLYLTRNGRVIWDLTAAPYTLDLTKGNTTGYGLRIVAAPKATTDLEDVQGDKVQCTKVLINNHVFILRGEQLYDATGRLVK